MKKGSRYTKPAVTGAKVKKKAGKLRRSSGEGRAAEEGSAAEASGPVRKKRSLEDGEVTKRVKSPAKNKAEKAAAQSALPEEYGENDLLLLVVDPDIVYASWEIRHEDLPRRGGLKMRFFDVTGMEPACDGDRRFLDIALAERVGSGFFEIRMNGREVVAEIGNMSGGRFVPILRSHMVSFPAPFPSMRSEIQGLQAPTTPIGY